MHVNKSLFAVLILISISFNQDKPLSMSSLQGKWEGLGHFLDIKLAKEFGLLPIVIIIDADGGVTGKIGDATLVETKLGTWKEDGFEIRAIIAGSIKTGKIYRKDHFIIFGHIQESEMDINYHLKSNYYFDFSMNVCGIVLKRVP